MPALLFHPGWDATIFLATDGDFLVNADTLDLKRHRAYSRHRRGRPRSEDAQVNGSALDRTSIGPNLKRY